MLADLVIPVAGLSGSLLSNTLRMACPPPAVLCRRRVAALLGLSYAPTLFAAVIGVHLQVRRSLKEP